jgi:hypothetical protein
MSLARESASLRQKGLELNLTGVIQKKKFQEIDSGTFLMCYLYNSILEGPLGFEPRTRGLKGRCSNLLSYGPTQLTDYIIPVTA